MSDFFIGEIRLFPYTFPPRYWMLCQGQSLNFSQFQALGSLLQSTFSPSPNNTTFNIPDLQGRAIVGSGTLPGSTTSYAIGYAHRGGVEQVTLTPDQVPPHTHALNASNTAASTNTASGNLLGTNTNIPIYVTPSDTTPLTPLSPATVAVVGGNPHSNMQPTLVMSYCIAVNGIYPTRS
ncbi:phage tail protein [Pararhodospirillum photometricum]|uniref:phage tail protein n=1 Tax=Pararhodospirillum photometricum TaxID=1084 RepID=UPI0009D96543|nr:tail fiber protein [Pararhodospirillum photometricum]